MGVCAGAKRDGSSCTVIVEPPKKYCWWHDPDHANQRKRSAAKAGRSKPNRELSDLKELLADLTDRVLSGELETGKAAVANQLVNTHIRALEAERRVREQEEVLQRLEALERRQDFGHGVPTKGGRRVW